MDAAGNVSAATWHIVEIDTQGPSLNDDIQVTADPRPDGYPQLGIRNYTASTANGADWLTNSNWPVFTAACHNCEFVNANPDPVVIWWPEGSPSGQPRNCSDLPGISNGTMYCSFVCLDGIPDSLNACLNVHFDSWSNNGHNGVLTVPLGNVFKDTAGNSATGNSTLDIFNQPPVINIGG